jgi:PAS domain S-box-containing protein
MNVSANWNAFVENSPLPSAVFNREMRCLAANGAWLGGQASDGHSPPFLHKLDRDGGRHSWSELHRRALAGEVISLPHVRLDGVDGSVSWERREARPWRNSNGEIGGSLLFFEDVTARRQAEEHRQLFTSLVEHSQEFIGMCDSRFVPFFVNDEGMRLVGLRDLDEAKRTRVQDYFFPEDRPFIMETFFPQVMRDGQGEVEIRFRHFVTGDALWMAYSVYVLRDPGGSITGLGTVSRNLTQKKKALDDLAQTQRRLQALMDAVPVGVSYSDSPSCERITGNPALLAQFEIGPEDNISASASDPAAAGRLTRLFLDGRELSGQELPLQRAVAERREIGPMEMEILLPSGRRWFAEASGAPILGEQGELLGGVAVTVDVTARKEFEAKIRQSEQRERQRAAELQALLDTAPVGLAIAFDAEGKHIRGNRANEEMLGLSPGAQLSMTGSGAPGLDVIQDGRRLTSEELPMQQALKGKTVADHIISVIREDGRRLTVLAKATPLRDEAGKPRGAVGAFLDISALQMAEESLRKSETLLTKALDAANAGVWESVPETGEFRASERAIALYGLPPGTKMTQEMALSVVHPDDRAQIEAALNITLSTGAPFRVELRTCQQDGHSRWLSSVAEAKEENGHIRLVGLIQDITERKLAEEALRASESRLSLALSAGRLATWDMLIPNGETVWNEEHFRALGYRVGEVAPSCEAWAARLHPDDSTKIKAAFAQALKEGGEYASEYRVLLPDQTTRWLEARGRIECDQEGHARRSYGVLIDTTDRKRAEDALREADRRKDEFLATLAHELRNPLAPIRNAVYVLKSVDQKDPAEQRRARLLLGMVERQVDHLVRLVDDLLETSRITTGKIKLKRHPVDLADVIQHAIETSQTLIQAQRHRLILSLSADPLIVDGDPVRLAQVFTNVINNAAKYTPPEGRIEIWTTRDGDEAVIRVRDNGIGIAPETLPFIFDLFTQSGRAIGREQGGIGVGLAIARTLTEMHGGTLQGHSEGCGHGAEFVVRLPLVDAHCPKPDIEDAKTTRHGARTRRVLVVDDNRDVADTLVMLLQQLGAETRVAYGGVAALEAVADFAPDLVLLDVGMPRMDGYETAKRIRRLPHGAQMTLVALTGWGQETDRQHAAEAGFDSHFVKPIDPAILERLLQEGAPACESVGEPDLSPSPLRS